MTTGEEPPGCFSGFEIAEGSLGFFRDFRNSKLTTGDFFGMKSPESFRFFKSRSEPALESESLSSSAINLSPSFKISTAPLLEGGDGVSANRLSIAVTLSPSVSKPGENGRFLAGFTGESRLFSTINSGLSKLEQVRD